MPTEKLTNGGVNMASSALNQLIAAQRGPDISGSVMGGIRAAKQEQAADRQSELQGQQISLGQKQLAGMDQKAAQEKKAESLKFAANLGYQIKNEQDPARRAELYNQGRQAGQFMDVDTSWWPQQYDDKTQVGLDNAIAHVYGSQQVEADLKREAKPLPNDVQEAQYMGIDLRTPEGRKEWGQFKQGMLRPAAGVGEITPYQQEQLVIDRERQRISRDQLEQGKTPAGYRRTENGLEPIPGGPADVKAQQAEQIKSAGASDVDLAIGTLRDAYDRLEKGGGITSTEKGALSNIAASTSSSGVGQTVGKMLGTSNQSARNDIAMTRPALLGALMKATGMSAKQMDSNAELKLWLATATDPTLDVESNRRALDKIEKKYMGGGKSEKSGHQVGDVIEHAGKKYRVVGGDPNDPDLEPIE